LFRILTYVDENKQHRDIKYKFFDLKTRKFGLKTKLKSVDNKSLNHLYTGSEKFPVQNSKFAFESVFVDNRGTKFRNARNSTLHVKFPSKESDSDEE